MPTTVSVAVPIGQVWANPSGFVVTADCAARLGTGTSPLPGAPHVQRPGAATFYHAPNAAAACMATPGAGCPAALATTACAKPVVLPQGTAVATLTPAQWGGVGAGTTPVQTGKSGWCTPQEGGGAACILPATDMVCSAGSGTCTLSFTR